MSLRRSGLAELARSQCASRILRALWTLVAGCMFLLASPVRAADDITLQPRQTGPRTWAVIGEAGMASPANRGFMSNAGFVVTDDGVVVFDALGTPALGKALLDAIGRVTRQPVRLLVLSHYHADHYYGTQAFKDAGVEVWAHAAGRGVTGSDAALQRLEQRRRDLFPWVNDDTRLVDADRWLDFPPSGELAFSRGGVRFRLVDVSAAHSPGDIMMFVEDEQLLFAGDLYFTGRIPFVAGADTGRWLQALDRVATLQPRMAVPGHGQPSTRVVDDLHLTRDYLRDLRSRMAEAVRDMIDFEQAYDAMDWSAWSAMPAFMAANRLNARSVYLELEQESLKR